MNATLPIAVLDEAALRRMVGEELDARLAPILAAIKSAMPPAPEADEPLTRKELATLLGIGLRTLRRMHLAGLLPPPITASQRLVRWPRKTITAWLDAGGHIQARARLRISNRRACGPSRGS